MNMDKRYVLRNPKPISTHIRARCQSKILKLPNDPREIQREAFRLIVKDKIRNNK